jgi:hypothetical protein
MSGSTLMRDHSSQPAYCFQRKGNRLREDSFWPFKFICADRWHHSTDVVIVISNLPNDGVMGGQEASEYAKP